MTIGSYADRREWLRDSKCVFVNWGEGLDLLTTYVFHNDVNLLFLGRLSLQVKNLFFLASFPQRRMNVIDFDESK